MGQVFLCSDRELGRKVALKCLLTSRQDAGGDHDRIVREAKAAASINHPNVASVHHVIEHGERAFIVMEYVHGENLAAALTHGRLPMARVVEIGRELASALSAAHAKGVIHRDLKPANIQMGSGGGVKVLDFGVARATFGTTAILVDRLDEHARPQRVVQRGARRHAAVHGPGAAPGPAGRRAL